MWLLVTTPSLPKAGNTPGKVLENGLAKDFNIPLTACCSGMQYYHSNLTKNKCHAVFFNVQLDYPEEG